MHFLQSTCDRLQLYVCVFTWLFVKHLSPPQHCKLQNRKDDACFLLTDCIVVLSTVEIQNLNTEPPSRVWREHRLERIPAISKVEWASLLALLID